MDEPRNGQAAERVWAAERAESTAPTLSIGLPVYNGARYLRSSIESLLAQDVGDLELLISDNASTDETPSICAPFAASDRRVRYVRNAENIGAAANFNQVFEGSRGRFFMWGSADDIWDPRFASACIRELEAAPDAVMCTSEVAFVDENGRPREIDWYHSLETRGMPIEGRVHELLAQRSWFGMYSVFRPEALGRTSLYRSAFGGDVHLLLELLLLGDAARVPDRLFTYRLPLASKTTLDHAREIHAAGATIESGERRQPWSGLLRALWGIIEEAGLDRAVTERLRTTFVTTLSEQNTSWGNAILAEYANVRPGTDPLPAPLLRLGVEAALSGLAVPPGVDSDAWQMPQGVRLPRLRGVLLRLLQPFGERQDRRDAEQTAALALLSEEVRSLRERQDQLEREIADAAEQHGA